MSTRHHRSVALVLGVAVCLGAGAACSGDEGGGGAGQPVTSATVVSNGLSFEQEALTIRAGEEVTVTYDNAHDGVVHNIHFRAAGDPKTEVTAGPDVMDVSFKVDEPGEYTYVCDVHATQMTGTLFVVKGQEEER